MKRHFTKATIEAEVFCKPCGKSTQWEINGGRPMRCLRCSGRLEEEHNKPKVKADKQDAFNFES